MRVCCNGELSRSGYVQPEHYSGVGSVTEFDVEPHFNVREGDNVVGIGRHGGYGFDEVIQVGSRRGFGGLEDPTHVGRYGGRTLMYNVGHHVQHQAGSHGEFFSVPSVNGEPYLPSGVSPIYVDSGESCHLIVSQNYVLVQCSDSIIYILFLAGLYCDGLNGDQLHGLSAPRRVKEHVDASSVS